ncbi:hypothetical protein [Maricaulis sp.]|uniref:hypothetical protein n=1 Tax=Maricaulis sp. TaxID=1486257 RepID=UPI003A8C938E
MSARLVMTPDLTGLLDVLTAGIDAVVATRGPLSVRDASFLARAHLHQLGVTDMTVSLDALAEAARARARLDGAISSRAVAGAMLAALAGQDAALRAAAQRARGAI